MKSLSTISTTPAFPTKSSSIQLTHPRICSFYESNLSISPETVNLFIIDLLESIYKSDVSIPNQSNLFQITELSQTFEAIRQTILETTSRFSNDFLIAKTKYIHEFSSIWEQSDCVSKRKLLLDNNATIIKQFEQMLQDIINIKGVHHSVGEKIGNINRQFHKIINANIESILSKSSESATLVPEFIQNFEINASHMAQTIQQILCDFVSTKETQTKNAIELLNQHTDNANSVYSKLMYELTDFIQNIRSRSTNPISELHFESMLSRIYNTASINVETPSTCVLSRENKPSDITIQHLDHLDRNINTDEIKSFLKTIQEKNTHGVLISQHTGITSKPNLYIEIHNSHVCVYVHNLEFSPEKIQTAIEIVDTVSAKLSEFNISAEQKYSIPKDILDDMNREYQTFISQKELILNTLKESHKKIVGQIEEIHFTTLDKYLSTRYSSCRKQGYVCNLCNHFTVSTLKGLAAHKRGCQRKLVGNPVHTNTSDTKSSNKTNELM